MALLVTNKVIKDQWHILEDDAQIDGGDNMIVSVERWQRDRDDLIACNRDLGIVLKSDQPPNLIEKDIQRFSVICLEFPKFTDGRAYSYARLLRNKYGFKGELRAVGNVLRDQLAFMQSVVPCRKREYAQKAGHGTLKDARNCICLEINTHPYCI